MLGQCLLSQFQQQPLVFLILLSSCKLLLNISEHLLSSLPQRVGFLLLDYQVIHFFGFGG
jgi:hypothetical protein